MTDYSPQTWSDGAGGGTPLSAARLNTMETGIAGTLQKSGGTMTGSLVLNADATAALEPTSKQQVDTADALKADLTGATFTGGVTMSGSTEITAATAPTVGSSLANRTYVDTGDTNRFDNVDVQVITVTGSWSKPAGAVKVKAELVGGGGAGGGVSANTGGGGAGGGGAYVCKWFDASELAASEAVTIGAGGTGTNSAGAAGGATTLDTIAGSLSAAGGSGGPQSEGAIPEHVNGGAGGTASGGDINVDGQSGGDVYVSDVGWLIFGGGGSSGRSFGGGHKPFATSSTDSNGTNAIGYGGGGGGSGRETSGTATGGSGTDGIAIITTYTAT